MITSHNSIVSKADTMPPSPPSSYQPFLSLPPGYSQLPPSSAYGSNTCRGRGSRLSLSVCKLLYGAESDRCMESAGLLEATMVAEGTASWMQQGSASQG